MECIKSRINKSLDKKIELISSHILDTREVKIKEKIRRKIDKK